MNNENQFFFFFNKHLKREGRHRLKMEGVSIKENKYEAFYGQVFHNPALDLVPRLFDGVKINPATHSRHLPFFLVYAKYEQWRLTLMGVTPEGLTLALDVQGFRPSVYLRKSECPDEMALYRLLQETCQQRQQQQEDGDDDNYGSFPVEEGEEGGGGGGRKGGWKRQHKNREIRVDIESEMKWIVPPAPVNGKTPVWKITFETWQQLQRTMSAISKMPVEEGKHPLNFLQYEQLKYELVYMFERKLKLHGWNIIDREKCQEFVPRNNTTCALEWRCQGDALSPYPEYNHVIPMQLITTVDIETIAQNGIEQYKTSAPVQRWIYSQVISLYLTGYAQLPAVIIDMILEYALKHPHPPKPSLFLSPNAKNPDDHCITITTHFFYLKWPEPILAVRHCLNRVARMPGQAPTKDLTLTFDSERDMIMHWTYMVRETFDADQLGGHNFILYDLPYLYDRACVLGMEQEFERLLRYRSRDVKMKESVITINTKGRGKRKQRRIFTPGLRLFDTLQLAQQMRGDLPNYKLTTVVEYLITKENEKERQKEKQKAKHKLQQAKDAAFKLNDLVTLNRLAKEEQQQEEVQKKRDAEQERDKKRYKKRDVPYEALAPYWFIGPETRWEIADYNGQDVQLVDDLIRQRGLLDFAWETSADTYTSLTDVVIRGQSIRCWNQEASEMHGHVLLDHNMRRRLVRIARSKMKPEDRLKFYDADFAPDGGQDDPIPYEQRYQNDNEDDNDKTKKDAKTFRGARLVELRRGFYDSFLATLDFSGLYPSIVITFKPCLTRYLPHEDLYNHEALEKKDKNLAISHSFDPNFLKFPTLPPSAKYHCWFWNELSLDRIQFKLDLEKIPKDHYVILVVGAGTERCCFIHRWPAAKDGEDYPKAFVCDSCEAAVNRRSITKALKKQAQAKGEHLMVSKYDAQQLCFKCRANSIYGFHGNIEGLNEFIFISQAICLLGRILNMFTEQTLLKRYGRTCVYGDTDSVMPWYQGVGNIKQAYDEAIDASKYITSQLPGVLKLEFENLKCPAMFYTPKGYAYVKVWDSDHGQLPEPYLVVQGLGSKRRNYNKWFQRTFDDVLKGLMLPCYAKTCSDQVLFVIKKALKQLEKDQVPVEELCRSCQVQDKESYKKEISLAQAILAERMRKRGELVSGGDRINFVYVAGDPAGKIPLNQRAETPDFVADKGLKIDKKYYRDQLMKNAAKLLEFHPDILMRFKQECLQQSHSITDYLKQTKEQPQKKSNQLPEYKTESGTRFVNYGNHQNANQNKKKEKKSSSSSSSSSIKKQQKKQNKSAAPSGGGGRQQQLAFGKKRSLLNN